MKLNTLNDYSDGSNKQFTLIVFDLTSVVSLVPFSQIRQKQGQISLNIFTESLYSVTTLFLFQLYQVIIPCSVSKPPLKILRFDLQVGAGAGQENRLSSGSDDDLIFRLKYCTTCRDNRKH